MAKDCRHILYIHTPVQQICGQRASVSMRMHVVYASSSSQLSQYCLYPVFLQAPTPSPDKQRWLSVTPGGEVLM